MEADQQVQDFLFDLPPELTDLIYSTFLSESKWRFLMRRVCKRWMNFINITDFKLGLVFGPEVKEIADSFSKYTTYFGLNFSKATIHTIRTEQYAPLTKLSNLTSLTIAHQKLTDGRDPTFISALTNLEHLDVYSISETTLKPLIYLKSLSAVVYTAIDYYADEPPSNNPIRLNLPFLESAVFTPVKTREWFSVSPSEVPPLLSFGSRLTKLTINKFVDMALSHLTRLRIFAYQVKVTINGISKLGNSLRSLSLTNYDEHVDGLDEIKFLKHLTHLDAVTSEEIDISGLTSLQVANIKNITLNDEYTYNQLTSLSIASALPDWSYLTRMTLLESFELRLVAFEPPEDIIYFTALKKLKYLILSGSQWHDNYTTLSQLRTLKLIVFQIAGLSSIPYDLEKMRKKIPLYTEYIMPTP